MELIEKNLQALRNTMLQPVWCNVLEYLADSYPEIYSKFSRFDEDGYETVGRHPFDIWLAGQRTDASGRISKLDDDELEEGEIEEDLEDLIIQAAENINAILIRDRRRLAKR